MNDKLLSIQAKIKVPKNQFNKFGKYYFRNLEDILEAVKPHLVEHKLTLLLDDEIVNVGNHNYIKATATLSDGKESISAYAYAREAEQQTGMQDAQLTGSTSSYARKYALNGLFAIDDTKDADSQDNTPKAAKKPVQAKQDPLAVAKNNLQKALKSFGHDNEVKMKVAIEKVLKKPTVDTVEEANEVMQALEDGLI